MVRETIRQFVQLQTYDGRIKQIDELLAGIPELLKDSRESYEAAAAELDSLKVNLAQVKTELLTTEAAAAKNKDHLENTQKKLSNVHNNKEYESALKELDNLKKGIVDTELKASDLRKKTDTLQADIESKEKEFADKENQYKTEKIEKEDENKALFEELAKLKHDREAFAGTVKKPILAKYERIRAARNNIAIAPIDGETCVGCSMKVPPQFAVDVKRENDLLQCPYCQRFLYQPKEDAQ